MRMGELIDALLSLSRVSRRELRREPVDLGQVARTIVRRFAAQEPGREVEFVIAEPLWVSADPALARALLENLLDNAWKFTRGVATPRVEVGSAVRDGEPAYYVQDNGAGFDLAHAARLFTPFARLHPEREFPGTGIGLATVQRIAHRHGGVVWAESEPGRGARFSFTLPGDLRGGER
jgi:signal transduction histidine kinase